MESRPYTFLHLEAAVVNDWHFRSPCIMSTISHLSLDSVCHVGFTQCGNGHTCNQVEGIHQILLTVLIDQLFDVKRELLVTLL